MASSSEHFQKMRKVSSQILVKIICEKFHQNRPQDAATKGCDRHPDRHYGHNMKHRVATV